MNSNAMRLVNLPSTYSRSFTAAALMLSESTLIVELYLNLKNWNLVKKEAVNRNILNSRTKSSLTRIVREAVTRLSNLSENQIDLFHRADKRVKQLILWYAICKTFKFINDFAKEVLYEKYLKMESIISSEDINVFFTKKAGWDQSLECKSESTKRKMKQILIRILREAEFIDSNGRIQPVLFSAEFLSCMSSFKDWQYIYPAQIRIQENLK